MSIDPKGRLVIPVGFTHDEQCRPRYPIQGVPIFIVDMDNLSIEKFIKSGKVDAQGI